jgi:hypothetical protein
MPKMSGPVRKFPSLLPQARLPASFFLQLLDSEQYENYIHRLLPSNGR